jgi:hypothetical protein
MLGSLRDTLLLSFGMIPLGNCGDAIKKQDADQKEGSKEAIH